MISELGLRIETVADLLHWWRKQQAAIVELVAHQRQAQDAALKPVRETAEERRLLLVFEQVELTDDVIAFLAGVDEFLQ